MRTLKEIAKEIKADWKKMYFGAVPYVEAMSQMTTMDSYYIYENGYDIVPYFLANATTWKGEVARRIKAELKDMLKH